MQHQDPPRAQMSDLVKLALVAGILFFISLGARDLWNPNEPIYGRAVVEMEAHDTWLIPTVNDKVFAEKPALYYWGALAAAKVFGGVNEFSVRVPAALAGLASVLLTYLLILPYVGRRRALLSAALFMTLYQVFWASRAVQMDVLVLASTLGVIVPLTRLIDFQARPERAFALAGLAAGLGFAGKGPVAWVVPGVVIFFYAAWSRRLDIFFRPPVLIGAAVAIVVSSPWYVMLWLQGETAFLYEALFRQNVTRFLDAWDHRQPWWYYFEYLWFDYAPWSWLLPAAGLMSVGSQREAKLHRLSWIWIIGVIAFFSLSESKRAPYILPIAPAVAALAGGVVDRWIFGPQLERKARIAAVIALSILATVFLIAGIAALVPAFEIPPSLSRVVMVLGILLAAAGLTIGYGLMRAQKHPTFAPWSLLAWITLLYLVAAVWALPAADAIKSPRAFTTEMNRQIEASGNAVASFRFWDWRSGYTYYADRIIPNLKSGDELETYWQASDDVFVLVEDSHEKELRLLLPDAELVHQGKIGSRRAYLFAKATMQGDGDDLRPEG